MMKSVSSTNKLTLRKSSTLCWTIRYGVTFNQFSLNDTCAVLTLLKETITFAVVFQAMPSIVSYTVCILSPNSIPAKINLQQALVFAINISVIIILQENFFK